MGAPISKYEYDVFISSKSEDYPIAEQIYDFLHSKGLSVFLASKKLDEIGEAQYALAIDEAIDKSNHMVVVASSIDHIFSKWIQYEWSIFSNDLKSGYKTGNLLTVLSPRVSLKDLPASLRHQQSFIFKDYQKVLSYLPKQNAMTSYAQNQEGDKVIYKIRVNQRCRLYIDDEELQILEPSKLVKVLLDKGEYLRKVVSLENESLYDEKNICLLGNSVLDDIKLEGGNQEQHEDSTPKQPVKEVITVNGISFTMVQIEAGTFTMGATPEQGKDAFEDEKPAHEVSLSGYLIGETVVTQELWWAVMGSNPSYFQTSPRNPVEQITWKDCLEFIEKLNRLTNKHFRLPTEAEWEYAARGGHKSKGYKFAGGNILEEVAWADENSESVTHPVAQKNANELGLYDMSGNVWEWCRDWKGPFPAESQVDPQGPSSGTGRIFRGGSWNSSAWNCRISYRNRNSETYRSSYLGMRLAMDIDK